jgi:hypothetical protein
MIIVSQFTQSILSLSVHITNEGAVTNVLLTHAQSAALFFMQSVSNQGFVPHHAIIGERETHHFT